MINRFRVILAIIIMVLFFGGIKQALAAHYPNDSLLSLKNKSDGAVYYIAPDGKKYVFPDSKTYYTWFDDFSQVIKVTMEELDQYENGGTMPYKAGVKLIKNIDSAKVYAVEPNGMLKLVPTEDMAKKLYGDKWYMLVQDVQPGIFVTSYIVVPSTSEGTLASGTVIRQVHTDNYFYVDREFKRKFKNQEIM